MNVLMTNVIQYASGTKRKSSWKLPPLSRRHRDEMCGKSGRERRDKRLPPEVIVRNGGFKSFGRPRVSIPRE